MTTTVHFTATLDGVTHAPFTVDGTGGTRVYAFVGQPPFVTIHNDNAATVQYETYRFRADATDSHWLGDYFILPGDSLTLTWNATDPTYGGILFNCHQPISPAGMVRTVYITYDPPITGLCAYGIERNPDAAVYTVVTAAVVDVIAALLGLGPLGITALDAMIGAPLLGPTCDAGPPTAPTFTPDDFVFGTGIPSPSGLAKLPALLASGAWHFYCHCTPAPPGSPAPIEYTPPDYSGSPIGTGDQPTPVCDASDICTYLNQISRMLNAMSLQLRGVRQDVTLIQRQHVPFAYIAGPSSVGLTGQGIIDVQGILGLSVTSTAIPTHLGLAIAEPTAHLFLGEITFGTPDGWTDRIRLTRTPQIILDVSAAVTRIGYSFEAGVTADVQTFYREP